MRSEARKNSPRLMAAWAVCGLTMMAASSFAAAITISSPDGQATAARALAAEIASKAAASIARDGYWAKRLAALTR